MAVRDVPCLDVAAVESEADGALTVFIASRHQAQAIDLDVALEGGGDRNVIEDKEIAGHDLKATNGPDVEPIAPTDGTGAGVAGGGLSTGIAPLCYRMIRPGA